MTQTKVDTHAHAQHSRMCALYSNALLCLCWPLLSHVAGHTPYSLPGSTGSSGRILEELDPEQEQQQEQEQEEEENSADSTALPLITASGIPRVCAGSSSSGRPSHSSGVRMELFTSVIHEVTEEEGQVTPAGAAALRCPKTPLDMMFVPAGDSAVGVKESARAQAG
jgi:hypothetical protein